MKRNAGCLLISIVIIIILAWKYRPVPRFERWDIELLKQKEISPLTPIDYMGRKDTELARKWYIKNYGDKIDKNQFLIFNADGTFYLHITDDASLQLKEELNQIIPSDSLIDGTYSGTFKCYDVLWHGGEGASSYGIILFDNNDKELSRCVVTCAMDDPNDFDLSKAYLPNPYRDDIRQTAYIELIKP